MNAGASQSPTSYLPPRLEDVEVVISQEILDLDELEDRPADRRLHLRAGHEMPIRSPGRVPVHDNDGRVRFEGRKEGQGFFKVGS